MLTVRGRDLADARRLEFALVGLRWFVVAFGVAQFVLNLQVRPDVPDYVAPVGFVLVAILAICNVVILVLTEKAQSVGDLRPVGLGAFILDVAMTLAMVWTYSTRPSSTVWLVTFILPLEGAVRYQVWGATIPVALTLGLLVAQELEFAARFDGYRPNHLNIGFRVGIQLAVALVAGFMARSLERQADKARERAWLAEEAARLAEEAARREAAARKELSAFHTAILAGVAAEDVNAGLQSMAESIARDLEFEAFALWILEDQELVARGVHGDPGYEREARVPLGEGLVGRVAVTGAVLLSTDVGSSHPVDPALEAEMPPPAELAVPLRVGGELIGVLHKRRSGGISRDVRNLMTGLADQIALVVQAARLRARQAETLRRVQELDEMKSDFVAITSHELRTPLAAIRGFIGTMIRRRDQLSDDEVGEFLGIVELQTNRLIALVEDLLVVSRIEAGRLTLAPVPIDPSALMRQVTLGLGEAGRRVSVETAPDLPGVMLADPTRLDQILTNLLQNALKFSGPESPVILSARADGASIVFSVSDQGIGIPPEEIPRIFERFHQAEAASTRQAEGTGLGLYITRRLVEAMGGEISVDSQPGLGSTFTVRLPKGPSPAPAPPSEARSAERTAS